jgi:hypothetical protein
MPSSLARVLSRALVYSTRPRVSVCGTGTQSSSLRGFSWKCGLSHFVGLKAPRTRFSEFTKERICLLLPPTSLNRAVQYPADLPSSVTPSLQLGGTGILTRFPSATPFGLTLGPDLPWADEPSPGTLGLTARWILTTFIATHAGILTSQKSRPPYGNPSTLWERSPTAAPQGATRSFGTRLEPRFIFGANPHRPVSCYALFKGWLLLSLPPGCLCGFTSFTT